MKRRKRKTTVTGHKSEAWYRAHTRFLHTTAGIVVVYPGDPGYEIAKAAHGGKKGRR